MNNRRLVWLASYPKSGNTWVRLLLGHLLGLSNDDEEEESLSPVTGIASNRGAFEFLLGMNTYELTASEIDRMRPDVYRRWASELTSPRFVKIHDAFARLDNGQALFPGDCSHGAIYIVRDPLDVAVSYAHHQGVDDPKSTVAGMNDPGRCIGGENREQLRQLMFDWSGHYRSWMEQDEMPVLLVRYEDLRADAAHQLRRMVEFVGLDEREFVMSVDEAVEASRFERLQQIEERKGFVERPPTSSRFFRSGRSGEGRENLPPVLQNELIAHHSDVMRLLGYLEEEQS